MSSQSISSCPEACPILDVGSAPQFMFTPPIYARGKPRRSGHFFRWEPAHSTVEEFREGEFLRYTAFEDYWGDTGYFDEVSHHGNATNPVSGQRWSPRAKRT